MLGFWYIAFGALGVAAAAATLWIIASKKYDKYDDICDIERIGTDAYRNARRKKFKWNDWGFAGEVTFVASLVIAWFSTLVAWLAPLSSRHDLVYFKQQSQYVTTAIINGDPLENIAITQTVIEQNMWLAKAKASLETFGIWSSYYGSGVEDLEPIVIERG